MLWNSRLSKIFFIDFKVNFKFGRSTSDVSDEDIFQMDRHCLNDVLQEFW